jgi:hypothetical protein
VITLRQGRKVGRTLYIQEGTEPSDADVLVGLVDSNELAAFIVRAINHWVPEVQREEELGDELMRQT